MEEHPGVIFREGPSGRRAVLVGGPDVREIIRALRSARDAEPDLGGDQLVDLIASNTGIPPRLIRIALRYWAAYPDEIDPWIDETTRFEDEALRTWQREQELLAR